MLEKTLLALALLVAAISLPLAGQVGVTTDILTGTVADTTGAPIAGATVEAVSLETGLVRDATTDGRGRYRILFPDGGGRYQLFVRQIGMAPARRLVERQGDDDRLVSDVRLAPQAVALEDMVVVGRRTIRTDQRPTPGATETAESPERLARLPIDAGDLNAIAALAAGVVGIPGSDSTSAGFSVAGQRPSANSTVLDGLSFGSQSIPPDAVRSIRVITNTYDVSRGQFSGGLIASTTRSGTSVFQGTANAGLRDPALAVVPDTETNQPQAQQQFSFGVGGPIVKNRFFGFGSGQARHRSNNLISLLTLQDRGAEQYGVAQDSVDRFVTALGALGIPVTTGDVPDSRSGTDFSGIGRLDLLLGRTQTLTLRGDWRESESAPARFGPLASPATGGRTRSEGGGVLLQLSSQFGQSILNEAKVYLSGTHNTGDPYLSLPAGRLQLASELSDGSLSTSTLSFGGNTAFPQRGHSTTLEATNEVSWLSADARHRVKLGLFLNTARTTQEVASNQLGTVTFLSLADLEAGRPALFTRTLGADERAGQSATAAAYLGDTWRMGSAWQATYGVRVEHSWFGDAPGFNPTVDSLFGLRTDRLPVETHVSPRAGFTWLVPDANGTARWTVRGGAGEFRSPIPPGLAVAAQAASGTATGQSQLVCAGPAAPTPDWSVMALDPAAIPTTCAGGLPGTPSTAAPSITAFAPGFTAPRVWRGSLGVQRRAGLVTVGLDLSAAFGVSQWGYEDRNVGPARFSLAQEGEREVYVDPSAIDPGTGTVSLADSRFDPAFGQVFEAVSALTTRSEQAVLSLSGIVGHGIALSASYTLSHATDQSSTGDFGGGRGFSSQTAGRVLELEGRTPSDFDRRHQMVTTVTVPVGGGLEITAIGRITSGAPFTPSVAGDINADGSRNDRAFIYDPATASDPAVAAGMARLLSAAPGRVQDCLTRQLGSIAGRNSCYGPWQPSFDLQLNWRPRFLGLDQRLTVSLLTSNLLAGLDQLFHGDNDLHGWGQYSRPDPTLLTVRGFDSTTHEFLYDVNGRFGDLRSGQTILQPFQVGLQMRLALGGTPTFGGGGGFGGQGGRGGGFRNGRPGGVQDEGNGAAGGRPGAGGLAIGDRLGRLLPDPVQKIVELNIQLRLTDDQLARLAGISKEYTQRRDSLGQAVQAEVDHSGRDPDRAVLFSKIRGMLEQGRTLSTGALEEAKAVLTAEQWAQLPEEIKSPPRPGGFQGRPRP